MRDGTTNKRTQDGQTDGRKIRLVDNPFRSGNKNRIRCDNYQFQTTFVIINTPPNKP